MITLILNACVSNKVQEIRLARDVTFHSKITTSGLKHFEVRVVNGSYTAYKTIDPDNYQSTQRRHRHAESKLEKITKEKLKRVGFCSSGYWLIEVQTLSSSLKVRGECNELATADDRKTFPDTLSQW